MRVRFKHCLTTRSDPLILWHGHFQQGASNKQETTQASESLLFRGGITLLVTLVFFSFVWYGLFINWAPQTG